MRQFIKAHKFSLIVLASAAVIISVILMLFSVDSTVNNMNIDYITSFGWEIDNRPAEISHLTIPQEFDVIYETYNAIAKDAGYDLNEYRGVKVTRYSYRVLNHQDSDTGLIRANVFVCKDKIVAADICSLDIGGFMAPINNTSGKRQ